MPTLVRIGQTLPQSERLKLSCTQKVLANVPQGFLMKSIVYYSMTLNIKTLMTKKEVSFTHAVATAAFMILIY